MTGEVQEDIEVYLRAEHKHGSIEHSDGGGYTLGTIVSGARLHEAADVIERLRATKVSLDTVVLSAQLAEATEENKRLRIERAEFLRKDEVRRNDMLEAGGLLAVAREEIKRLQDERAEFLRRDEVYREARAEKRAEALASASEAITAANARADQAKATVLARVKAGEFVATHGVGLLKIGQDR